MCGRSVAVHDCSHDIKKKHKPPEAGLPELASPLNPPDSGRLLGAGTGHIAGYQPSKDSNEETRNPVMANICSPRGAQQKRN